MAGILASHERMSGEPGKIAQSVTLRLVFVQGRLAGGDQQNHRYDTYYHAIYPSCPPGQTRAKESVHPNGHSSLADPGKVRESGRPAVMCTGIGFRTRMSRLYGSGGDPLEVCVSLL